MYPGIALILWAAVAAPPGLIAYVSGANDVQAVCVRDLASGATVTIGTPSTGETPAWSPDGARFAFPAAQAEGAAIAVAAADGSGLRLLKHKSPWNAQPRWSRDGKRLAYASGRGAQLHVAVYDLDADTETVWGGAKTPPLMRPVWFNDKTLVAVALVSVEDSLSSSIFQVYEDAVEPLRLPSEKDYFEWAAEPGPKGKFLAYESNDGGDREIFAATERKGANNVSNHRAADWNPVWSPDGKWLAFESFRNGSRGIFRTFPETSRVYEVMAPRDSDNWAPTWSPDGKWIAFVSDRGGAPSIYFCPVEGGKAEPLAQDIGMAFGPAWQPKRKAK